MDPHRRKLRGTPQQNTATRMGWVLQAAATVLPDADPATVQRCAQAVAATTSALGHLVQDVVPDPTLLISGTSRSQICTQRFIRALAGAGIAVNLPRCETCGSTAPLERRLPSGGMACRRCARLMSRATCSVCQQVRPRGRQTSDGSVICERCVEAGRYQSCSGCRRWRRAHRRLDADRVLCSGCSKRDPSTWEPCSQCGNRTRVAARPAAGPLCQNCYQRPARSCGRCGQLAEITTTKSGEAVCRACYRIPQTLCGACQHPRPRLRGRSQAECPSCGSTTTGQCQTCGAEAFAFSAAGSNQHRCLCCRFRARIIATLADHRGVVAAELVPFVDTLARVDDTEQATRWLLRGHARTVLVDIAHGRAPLTHATFDQAGGDLAGRAIAVEHLRRLMVASGLLPARDEHLARLERIIEARLRGAHPQDQSVLRSYAIWHTLARARQRIARGRPSSSVCTSARTMLGAPFHFLAWLRGQGISAEAIPQSAVDQWITQHPSSAIDLAVFLGWTEPRGLTSPVFIRAQVARDPTSFMPSQDQWALVRKALHDRTMQHRLRLAVCLVLLYGQPANTIVGLRRRDVTTRDGVTSIKLGKDAVELGEPLGQIARDLADRSVPDAWTGGIARAFPDLGQQWLLPGRGAGKALGEAALRHQLLSLGIKSRAARNTALLSLARDVPTLVLSDLLGVGASTAERWRHHAGGSWASYAPAGGYRPSTSGLASQPTTTTEHSSLDGPG